MQGDIQKAPLAIFYAFLPLYETKWKQNPLLARIALGRHVCAHTRSPCERPELEYNTKEILIPC